MILNNTLENINRARDKLEISDPVILQDFDCVANAEIESIEFNQDVKICIPKLMKIWIKKGWYKMLYTIAVILIILWILGLVTSYTMGGFIHILLVVAIIMFLVRIIKG